MRQDGRIGVQALDDHANIGPGFRRRDDGEAAVLLLVVLDHLVDVIAEFLKQTRIDIELVDVSFGVALQTFAEDQVPAVA